MAQTLLLHWNIVECEAMAEELRAAGIEVQPVAAAGDVRIADMKAVQPSALVISLRRLPSHGREVADAVWSTQWGRQIPIVFVDGAPDKVNSLRARFPAARFVSFDDLADLLRGLP